LVHAELARKLGGPSFTISFAPGDAVELFHVFKNRGSSHAKRAVVDAISKHLPASYRSILG
jgi:hypothetical protein